MKNIFLYMFLTLVVGIIAKSLFLSIDIPTILIILMLVASLIFKNYLKLTILFLAVFLLGISITPKKLNPRLIPESKLVFIECKVSSFPQAYYYKYRFNCIVLNSTLKELKNYSIYVVSKYKPNMFSDIYTIGKLKEKHEKLLFYVEPSFIKEEKFNLILPFLNFRQMLIQKFKEKTLNEKTFAIGSALIFGDKSYLDRDTKRAFINTGLIHLLAISGLHIAIITAILVFLISFFNKRLSYIISIIFLIIYPLIAGFNIPVVRSSFMGILYLYGKIRYLSINTLNLLFFTGFVFLFFSPLSIYSIGFQLSFLAVLGLILSKDIINVDIKNKLSRYLIQSLIVSFIATLWTMPVIIYYFHQFSPTSIFATTAEIGIIIPYLFLSVINLFTGFLFEPIVNLMDSIGILFLQSVKFFANLEILNNKLNLNIFWLIMFYSALLYITLKVKKYTLIFYLLMFILILTVSNFDYPPN